MTEKKRWLMPLFTLSMVGLLLFAVIITLQNEQTSPESLPAENTQPIAGNGGQTDGYPLAPAPDPNAYPGLIIHPTPTALVCSERTAWATYTDPDGHFSFDHPLESTFSPSAYGNKTTIRIFPKCYDKSCGQRSIVFRVSENPESLPIYEYVENSIQNRLDTTASLDVASVGQYVTVAGIEGIRLDKDLNNIAKPAVYVPLGDSHVFAMVLAEEWSVPAVFEPMCGGTVSLFDEILDSVQFLNTP